MANVLITEQYLYDIADAIRDKLGAATTYKPGEMADAIESISGGGGGGSSASAYIVTGTFVSADTQYGIVNVDCGFEPELVLVTLPFNDNDTTSFWWKNASWGASKAIWELRPAEQNGYMVDLGRQTGETGIQAINSNGFSFMSNASNTRGVVCKYVAAKGINESGVRHLSNGKVAQASPQVYIDAPLEKEMKEDEWYVITLRDAEKSYTKTLVFLWNGTTTYDFDGRQLRVTKTTAGLTYYSGSYRDIYCDIVSIGSNVNMNKNFLLKYYTSDASGSYEIVEDGVYVLVCATSHQSSHTITIPQTATIIDERSVNLGSGRGIEVRIVGLSAGDTVSITQTWSSWDRRAFFIVKLENITIQSNVSLTAVSDGSATGTTTSDTKSFVLGVGLGASKRNDSSLNYSALLLSGAWGME